MINEKIAARVIIKGKVQGVFFRVSTEKEANRLGINGWVKNCPNGDVEAFFEGEKSAINAIISWCHQGPAYSKVTSVNSEIIPFQNQFDSFSITG